VENYRAQFGRVLRRTSYAELLEQLRTAAGPGPNKPYAERPRTGLRADALAVAPLAHLAQTP
jgi:hypothetical protein